MVRRIMFSCDPVGIRTQDPQLRRLLLYPAELPDRPFVFMRRLSRKWWQCAACLLSVNPGTSRRKVSIYYLMYNNSSKTFLTAVAGAGAKCLSDNAYLFVHEDCPFDLFPSDGK